MTDEQKYLSYSSMMSWLSCGKAYFLRKVQHVDEVPAWWFVGGRAVHSTTEEYDRWLFENEGR